MPQLVRFSAGFVYRDLFNLSKQLVMKAFRVGMTRRGEVSSDRTCWPRRRSTRCYAASRRRRSWASTCAVGQAPRAEA